MKKLITTLLFLVSLVVLKACKEPLPYLNHKLDFETRTDDLLSRMTLEEKVQFMRYDSPGIERLGIPAYNWWNECLHGVGRSGLATVFPQAIGMAAMWDTAQMRAVGDVISNEARAKYHDYVAQGKRNIYQGLTFWTPNINIFRDPRWGRGMETYGEDPYLTAELAIPFIQAMQGNDPKYFKLIATVKHFAVHSGPEPLRHSFDVWPSDYDLAETYLPHFRRTVQEADVYSVMCAYQRLMGKPCCGSKYLENLLRSEWGFEGYVVSDCWAIRDFYEKDAHNVVATPAEAVAMGVQAGTDLNCGNNYYPHLLEAVEKGYITEAEIDVSVRRLILARMKLGQFDPDKKVPYASIPLSVLDSEHHRLVALETARKSMVLLKNESNLLPFSKEVKKVAVIGPNADEREVMFGNYNGYPSSEVTPLAAIREKLPNAVVSYAPGCHLADGMPLLTPLPDNVYYTDKTMQTPGLQVEYFDNIEFAGEPVQKQLDSKIDYVWWDKSPVPGLSGNLFAVRWKGVILPPISGTYTLGGEGFSGFRMMVDNQRFVNVGNSEHNGRRASKTIELKAGVPVEITVEYMQNKTEYAHMRLLWEMPNKNLQQEALALAADADLVVLCMGLSPLLEGEEMKVDVKGFKGGDREEITLPESQQKLIKEIHKLGKPVVLVLMNGSALAINWEAANLPAILEAWYPGQSGGTAIADVIFGDYNPGGRLPVTFYKDIKDIPAFEDYDMTGKTYRYFEGEALYGFGHGLSYSRFEYKVKSLPATIQAGDELKIEVELKNAGKWDGDEVVQLYVSHPDSKQRKAIRSLKGFQRVHLKAGETKILQFVLKPGQMAVRNEYMQALVEPGNLQLSIGGRQPDAASVAAGDVLLQSVVISGQPFIVIE